MKEPTVEERINKAKDIIADIHALFLEEGATHFSPKGYGNWELNRATDAMYAYIKQIDSNNLNA